MQAQAEILAYHGWGYNADFWSPLQKLLSPVARLKAADRGYFGKAVQPRFETTGLKIIFAHSLGLHLIPEHLIQQADTMVLMAAFEHFIPANQQQAEVMKRLLKRMNDKMLTKAHEVVHDFRERAEHASPSEFNIENLNPQLLKADLKQLEESRINLKELPQSLVIFIEGENDLIHKSPHRQIQPSDRIKYYYVPAAGHAFPLTHAEECFSIIKLAIPILGHHE